MFNLAHTVVKADFLDPKNLLLPGLGFLLQADRIIDFRHSPDLRLATGGATALNDFSSTSLCGRLAQGLALLYADLQGYYFLGPVKAHLTPGLPVLPGGKPEPAADFLFRNAAGERMVAESKGSFSSIGNNPTVIKSKLKRALTRQVQPTMARVSPAAQKGYVFYSHLRELGHFEKSALIFVDPPSDQIGQSMEIPDDWVLKENYAGWLVAMGMARAAQRLREDDSTRQSITLPIYRVGQWEIVGTPMFQRPQARNALGSGIELGVFERLERARSGDVKALLEYHGIPTDGRSGLAASFDFAGRRMPTAGSLLGDGTYFGPLRRRDFLKNITFRL